MPATPSFTVKPFLRRIPVRYLEVSYSWKPSSAKLNTESTICCERSLSLSTSAAASCFRACSLFGSGVAARAVGASNSAAHRSVRMGEVIVISNLREKGPYHRLEAVHVHQERIVSLNGRQRLQPHV